MHSHEHMHSHEKRRCQSQSDCTQFLSPKNPSLHFFIGRKSLLLPIASHIHRALPDMPCMQKNLKLNSHHFLSPLFGQLKPSAMSSHASFIRQTKLHSGNRTDLKKNECDPVRAFFSALPMRAVSDGYVNCATGSVCERHYQIDRQVRRYSIERSELTTMTTDSPPPKHSHEHELDIFILNKMS